MELLTGRDLAHVIRDDFPLPLLRVARVMTQVLNALDEAHAHGVIHRDLKPSNIMLIERRGEKDFVKVCDFGIAKATLGDAEDDRSAMLTVQGLVCGTPEYMSPEQARAEPLDGRADLYSAAVILYQLVTGDIPFRADSAMGIISRHLVEPPDASQPRAPRPGATSRGRPDRAARAGEEPRAPLRDRDCVPRGDRRDARRDERRGHAAVAQRARLDADRARHDGIAAHADRHRHRSRAIRRRALRHDREPDRRAVERDRRSS